MTNTRLGSRVRRLEARLGRSALAFLIVCEDEQGAWWAWDEIPPRRIDRASVPGNTRVVVIIRERPDGPQ